jgi:hypothetical protein
MSSKTDATPRNNQEEHQPLHDQAFARRIRAVRLPPHRPDAGIPSGEHLMNKYISMTVHEDAYGSNGDLSRAERIEHLAGRLTDWVFEALGEYDCGAGDFWGVPYRVQIPHEAYSLIERLVAVAVINQFEYDEGQSGEMIALVATDHGIGVPRQIET